MYIIVDDRNMVAGGYANGFDREGVSSAGIEASEFREWIGKISDTDMNAVEAFVIGDCNEREALSRLIRSGRAHPFCVSMSASRLTTRWVYSLPGRTTSCASRFMYARSSPGSGRSTDVCSAKTAT